MDIHMKYLTRRTTGASTLSSPTPTLTVRIERPSGTRAFGALKRRGKKNIEVSTLSKTHFSKHLYPRLTSPRLTSPNTCNL